MRVDRVVLDSNVLISAALNSRGAPRAVISAVESFEGVLLFSRETFLELDARIMRPKFDSYVSRQDRILYLAQLEIISKWVSITGASLGCRDRDDDKFLETALVGNADYLVTGDKDLLVMSPFCNIPIVQPTVFLKKFHKIQ